jgi:hypothetical protein
MAEARPLKRRLIRKGLWVPTLDELAIPGTSGGVLGFIATDEPQSSGELLVNRIVLGGGAGSTPGTPLGLGTSSTVLHGNAIGAPTWGPVTLTTDVSGTLPVGNGGTGLASGTSGGVLGFTAAGTLASSAALAANQIVLGGGAGATPATLGSLGTNTTVLHGNAAGAPSFGAVANADLANSSLTYNGVSVALGASGTLTLASSNFVNQGTTTTLLHGNAAGNPSWGQVNLAADVTGDLPFANLTQGSALSVLGVTGNAIADVASIAAGSDHQVLRRSGTALTFGAVNLAQSAAVTGLLPLANGGTAANLVAANGGVVYSGAAALAINTPGSSGDWLKSAGAGAPAWTAPAALTKADDTNVTLTLGGSPTTALLNAASLTLGWSGQLGLTRGGTAASLTASNGGIVYSGAAALAILAGTATAGQILRSGASAAPSWSTPTFPNTATANKALVGDGTNIVLSTPTIPLTSSPSAGVILRGDGTNWAASTATYPNAVTANRVLYATGSNAIGESANLTFDGSTLTVTGNVIASSGPNLFGYTSAVSIAGVSSNVQAATSASVSRFTNDAVGPRLFLAKSRNTSVGSYATVVQNNDVLGQIYVVGADGTNGIDAALISFEVDGPPGTGDMPTRIVFSVTTDGGSSVSEAARISQNLTLRSGVELKTGTYSAGDTTPTVKGVSRLYITNAGATTITNLDDGVKGQVVVLEFGDANTTFNRANAYLAGGATFTGTINDTLTLMKGEDGLWTELSRSVNS